LKPCLSRILRVASQQDAVSTAFTHLLRPFRRSQLQADGLLMPLVMLDVIVLGIGLASKPI
jgi:hypothetical protein